MGLLKYHLGTVSVFEREAFSTYRKACCFDVYEIIKQMYDEMFKMY